MGFILHIHKFRLRIAIHKLAFVDIENNPGERKTLCFALIYVNKKLTRVTGIPKECHTDKTLIKIQFKTGKKEEHVKSTTIN